MILRRLAANLKNQNWTAIVIEFVLLVSGVFLGTEVSNWNQEREQRNKAEVFTARLREDIRFELWAEQHVINYYQDVRENAELTLDSLSGWHPLADEQFLISAYRATQFRDTDRHRATYDELVSTGTIGLIADAELRRVAVSTFTYDTYEDISKKARESEYRGLFRETVPFDVQNALLAKCGDRDIVVLDYSSIEHLLDYNCTLGLPVESIRHAAAALRAQARLLPALQLRHADLGTAISDLSTDRQSKAQKP